MCNIVGSTPNLSYKFNIFKVKFIFILLSMVLLALSIGLVACVDDEKTTKNYSKATLSKGDGEIIGLDNNWIWSDDNNQWHTGASGIHFAGGITVRVASKSGDNAKWADAPLWSSMADHYSQQYVVYNGKLYYAKWWTNSKPGGPDWDEFNQPNADYTFIFDKKSEQEILDYLDKERLRMAKKRKVFAYMPSWGVYGGHEFYDVNKDLDIEGVTHITYGFVKPIDKDKAHLFTSPNTQDADSITSSTTSASVRFDDPWAAETEGSWMGGNGMLLSQIKAKLSKYNDKYFVFSVGGWSYSEHGEFEWATKTPQMIDSFAQSMVDFMQEKGFDGIDIDWEFPTASSKQQFLDLHRVVREKLTKLSLKTEKYYQLSSALTPNPTSLQYASPKELCQVVDTVNFMAYDYYGGSFFPSSPTNHNSPLYNSKVVDLHAPSEMARDDFNVDFVLKKYLQDVPSNQILLGFPFYSRRWDNVSSDSPITGMTGLGVYGTKPPEKEDSGVGAENRWGNGSNAYYTMEDLLSDSSKSYKRYWDNDAKSPYIYSPITKIYHSYNDTESTQIRVEYLLNNKLGGAVIWDISGDTRTKSGSVNYGTSNAHVLGDILKENLILNNSENTESDDAYIITSSLPNAYVDKNYNAKISASGKNVIFSLSANNPSWLQINPNSGQLSGIPTQASDSVNIEIVAKSDTGLQVKKTFNIKILSEDIDMPPPQEQELVITNNSLPDATVGKEYSVLVGTKIATNKPNARFEILGNQSFLIINPSTGQLSGMATQVLDSLVLNIKATLDNQQDTKSFMIKVRSEQDTSPTIDTIDLPDAIVMQEYASASTTIRASGVNTPFRYYINPIDWLDIDEHTGQLNGLPIASGDNIGITVKVVDTLNQESTKTYRINILDNIEEQDNIVFETKDLGSTTVDEWTDIAIIIKGLNSDNNIQARGLPNGLEIVYIKNTNEISLQGYPSEVGEHNITIIVSSNNKVLASKSYTLHVDEYKKSHIGLVLGLVFGSLAVVGVATIVYIKLRNKKRYQAMQRQRTSANARYYNTNNKSRK